LETNSIFDEKPPLTGGFLGISNALQKVIFFIE